MPKPDLNKNIMGMSSNVEYAGTEVVWSPVWVVSIFCSLLQTYLAQTKFPNQSNATWTAPGGRAFCPSGRQNY